MIESNNQGTGPQARSSGKAEFRLILLLLLWAGLSWPEMKRIVQESLEQSDTVHLAVAPIAILLLLWARRGEFRDALGRSSAWGVAIVAVGILLYAAMVWPFSFGYFRILSLGLVLAGLIAAAGGMALLHRCLPILLLLLLAVPLGQRLYASLIIRPETYTIRATAEVIDRLPGLQATVRGTDILYTHREKKGAIALGESNRGARLLMAFAFLGVWVAFYRHRSLGRLLFVAIAGLAVILICNLLRLLTWAVVQIYLWPDPISPIPRSVSSVVSLVAAYALFVAACSIRVNFFADSKGLETHSGADKESDHVTP